VRAVLSWGIDRQWNVTERLSTVKNLLSLQVFHSLLVVAVGAVDILASFTDGL
jgi:hypothetical protein